MIIIIRTSDQRTTQVIGNMTELQTNITYASRMDGSGFITVRNANSSKVELINVQHIIKISEFTQNPIG